MCTPAAVLRGCAACLSCSAVQQQRPLTVPPLHAPCLPPALPRFAGVRQVNRMRAVYLAAVLRQDVGYFDTTATSGEACLLSGSHSCQPALAAWQAQLRATDSCIAGGSRGMLSCGMCSRTHRRRRRLAVFGSRSPPTPAGRLLQGLNEDCQTIQAAIGDKVGMTVFNLSTAVVGIIIGAAAAAAGAASCCTAAA